MALEFSTAGVTLKYCVETTAGTKPAVNYITIPSIKSTPDFNPEPSSLDVTDLSDTVWKRYIPGLKDPGGAVSFNANLTSAFKTAWETLVTASDTGRASGYATWFEICVPNFYSFYFTGIPSPLGASGMEVDAVLEDAVFVTPNTIDGWGASSTTSP